jgi:uncharacterized protein YabE (DUF348 family)
MTVASESKESARFESATNLLRRCRRFLQQWRPGSKFWWGAGIVAVIALLLAGYVWLGRPVTLVINGQPYSVRIHRLTVTGALAELGLTLEAEDSVDPPLNTRLASGESVTVQLARPVNVEVDGRSIKILTHHNTISEVLAETGVTLNPHDDIVVNGTLRAGETLPTPVAASVSSSSSLLDQLLGGTPRGAVSTARPEPVQLIVRRAIPVTLNDGQIRNTFYTTQPTVGEALLEQGLAVFLADKVTPNLSTPLTPGMRIFIERSIPVNITVDGRIIKTRTRRDTVSEVLAQEGIALMGQDFTRPSLKQELSPDQLVEIVRVREVVEIEQELLPFEARWIPDSEMDLDAQELRQTGTTGSIKKLTRVRYENGQEVWRELGDEWLDREPEDRVIAYGTRITVHTLETEDGVIEYWRKIPMLATGYSAATSGKDPDHPRYGITRSGLPAGYGIVAVDPKVIPLMTNLYVPGYGPALAGDTGGKVLGKHIDLGFDEGQPIPDIYGWRDVYVLTPVPPPDQIRYVLPNWPQR